jgi:glycosyltransferase involved in cell wall biosynthesis
MKLYPEKNIRVISQPGIGQGDAIKEGFSRAMGSIIILLEADMTSPPENIRYVYESMRMRYAEFMEGSRFIYPISRKAMPYLNQIGNWCFSFFFSWLFWRQITDVMSGIKAIRKEDFEKILVRWNSWGIDDPFGDFELLFGAMRLGLKPSEQPIHYHPRIYGSSKTRVFYHGYILTRMALKAFSKFRG